MVYYDRGADPGDTMNTVSLRSSFDGGRTFAPSLRLSDRAFDSRMGLGGDRGMADLGDRLGLVATDGRALAVWTDTRAGTVADGRQDLASAVVDFPAPSPPAQGAPPRRSGRRRHRAGAPCRPRHTPPPAGTGGRMRVVTWRLWGRAAALVLLALVATGCGGGDDSPAISKVEYLKLGNVICVNGNERIAAVARQPAAGADPDALATFVRVFVPGIRDQLRQLRALGYPEGDKAVLVAIFDDAEAVLRRAERDPSTIDGHSFDDVNRRLTAYGLNICGS